MGCPLQISLETDHSAYKVLFQPISGQVWGVRTCSVLLEPELAHEWRVEGLEFTLEGFEDLHISLLGDCHCCARFFDEDWSDDASGWDCSPHRALRKVQGIGSYFIGSGVPPVDICLGVRLSVKMEVGFIWGPKEVKETWCLLDLLEHLDWHSAPLLLFWSFKGLYSVWVSPDIVHRPSPASLTGHTKGLTSLTHIAFRTLLERLSHTFDQLGCSLLGTSRVSWTVLTGSVEALHGPILLEVVHPVLKSAFGWSLFTFELTHETVLGFLKLACLVVKFNCVFFVPALTGVLVVLTVVDSAISCKIRAIGE